MKIEYPQSHFEVHNQRSLLASVLLQPAALIYRFASIVNKRRKGSGGDGPLEGMHIISVGNLEVGGGGKTPFCIYLLDDLVRDGHRPVYISRGYKSESGNLHQTVTVVLPAEQEACPPFDSATRFLSRDAASLCHTIGDEGAVVASRNPQVPIVISRNKAGAMRIAARLFQPTHLVLDDAFQSWGVHRDIDVVLLDAKSPFGRGGLVPAGTLREGRTALRRADAVGMNGMENWDELSRTVEEISRLAGPNTPVFGIMRRITLLTAQGDAAEANQEPVASLSSIARPAGFDHLLERNGFDVRLSIRFPDHYRYRREDIADIHRLARNNQLKRLITTEKDWVKLQGFEWGDLEVVITRLDLAVQPEDFMEKIKKPQATLAASF
jgi:tetraacyldisaccharide 4'-kinase